MKIIKIFLASSDELKEDREAFGNLVRRLDRIYERRGIRVELFEWEDYDAAFNGMRKQDEYNEQIKDSDLFLAMFHTLAGQYTVEEFNVATEEFRQHASPKVYVYCKDLQPGEIESQELKDFKKRLFEELGHYWCSFGNRDTMQLHFVMQLQLVESSSIESLKVEENGTVSFEGMPMANMAQLPFAAGNEDYRKMSTELSELPDKIDKARQRLEKFPDDDDLKDDLQTKLNRYNYLKETLAKLQQDLLSTAKTIADLQQQQVSARLRRAIEAFETGNLVAANTILTEIAHDADKERHIENYERQQQLAEKSQEIVHGDIEAFRLQAKTIMADVTITIDKRIDQVIDIYAKADDWAQRSAYPKQKYTELLLENADFLRNCAHYNEAEMVYLRQIPMVEELYGTNHPLTAASYNNLGEAYYRQGEYSKAQDYYSKALAIRELVMGPIHADIAQSYNNIGLVYSRKGDYSKALEFYTKAFTIRENVLDSNHTDIAQSYNNIGFIYSRQEDYTKALEYYTKALIIREKVFGTNHMDTAQSYNNIGFIYSRQGNYDKTLECYTKALEIKKLILGSLHPSTATSFNNIGFIYSRQGNYDKALEYYSKALKIKVQILNALHPSIATTCNNIGFIYSCKGEYSRALEYYSKALAIRKQVLGINNPKTQKVCRNIEAVQKAML